MAKVFDDNFHEEKTVKMDERGRVAVGATNAPSGMYSVSKNSLGQILLTPVVEIPAHEAWLYSNPVALGLVRQGLAEAAAGLGEKADFAGYADLEIDD